MAKSYREEVRDITRESWWTLGKVLGYVVLPLFVLISVLFALGTFSSVASAPGRVVQRTLETDNIIYNYEWFKRQHEAVGAMDRQIPIAEAAQRDAKEGRGSYQSDAEYARAGAVVQGLRQQRETYIAEYNARARMANRNIFMGSDLPERIEP